MDYRRITYGFIHADTPHLLANIGGQLIFSILVCLDIRESSWIRLIKAFLIYIFSIGGGSVAFDFVPNKETCGLVGASAGVFGLCGMCIVEGFVCVVSILSSRPFARDFTEYNGKLWEIVLGSVKLFLALILVGIDLYYNLPTDLGNDLISTKNNMDTLYVHIGGLMSGMILISLIEIINCIFHRTKL